MNPAGNFVLHGRRYAKVVQIVGNLADAHAVLEERENLADDAPCLFVHDEPVLVLRVFSVAVGRV